MPSYEQFNLSTDIAAATKVKTYPLWTDSPLDTDTLGQSILTSGSTHAGFYTSSAETASAIANANGSIPSGYWDGNYYLNVYAERVDSQSAALGGYNPMAEPQFSIAYGVHESASLTIPDTRPSGMINTYHLYSNNNAYVYADPQKAVYKQFANILTNDGSEAILKTSANLPIDRNRSGSCSMIYAYFISIARSRMKDAIDPLTWRLAFFTGSGVAPGSSHGTVLVLRANDIGSKNETKYDIVADGVYAVPADTANNPIAWFGPIGSFYPTKGVFVLDAKKLHSWIGLIYDPASTGSTGALSASSMASFDIAESGVDTSRALTAFYAALTKTNTGGGPANYFKAESEEVVTSTNYFVRVNNWKFNSTENPTWRTGPPASSVIRDEFITNPTTFITTVGLYDGASNSVPGDLVAIAKLSKPIMKNPESEAVIRIRLDY